MAHLKTLKVAPGDDKDKVRGQPHCSPGSSPTTRWPQLVRETKDVLICDLEKQGGSVTSMEPFGAEEGDRGYVYY